MTLAFNVTSFEQMSRADWQEFTRRRAAHPFPQPGTYALQLLHAFVAPDRGAYLLELLRSFDKPTDFLMETTGWPITNYRHMLQMASRAQRDGADEESVVCALLHDVTDLWDDDEVHPSLSAALLQTFVSEENFWILKNHGLPLFWYLRNHPAVSDPHFFDREYVSHPYYANAKRFAKWDQSSFDPTYNDLPLSFFEPMVKRVFSRVTVDVGAHNRCASWQAARIVAS
jgi:predicted HD phosphohydrolase